MFKKNMKKTVKRNAIVGTILLAVALTMGGCRKNTQTMSMATKNLNTAIAAGEVDYEGYDYGYYEGYDDYYEEYQAAPMEANGEVDYALEDAGNGNGNGNGGNVVAPPTANRKLIRTVDMQVETKEFDALKNDLYAKIAGLGGYIENEYSYNGSSYDGTRKTRYTNLIIRIPDAKLDGFVNEIGDMANVISKNSSATDVTLQYTDIESKRDMLRAEQESYLALLEKAESVEDIVYLTERLTEVRYSIESLERQLRVYDNQVDYATVSLNVKEVEVLTPQVVEEKTPGEEIAEGFKASLEDVINSLKHFGMNLIINLPYIIRALIILGIIYGVIRGAIAIIVKVVKKKRAKKAAAKADKAAEKKAGEVTEKKTDEKVEEKAENKAEEKAEDKAEDKAEESKEEVAENTEK